MGVGVFAYDTPNGERQAAKITALIHKGVKAAEPFFEWLANKAVKQSKLNVINKGPSLFKRYEYFLRLYERTSKQAIKRASETHFKKKSAGKGRLVTTIRIPSLELKTKANWLALGAIDCFFSWTEHVFIHLAILRGKITTGTEVTNLAGAEWQEKFKQALNLNNPATKKLFDKLVIIRRQLRNYMAHGAFGKRGEAFTFHSNAGAVPVLLRTQGAGHRFAVAGDLGFDENAAIKTVKDFVSHLWTGEREPARAYIQDSHLPIILTMAADGRYKGAMRSMEDMEALINYLNYMFDQAANMDW